MSLPCSAHSVSFLTLIPEMKKEEGEGPAPLMGEKSLQEEQATPFLLLQGASRTGKGAEGFGGRGEVSEFSVPSP